MTDKLRDEASAIVAQCWCDKRTEHLAMIPSLAEVIIEKVEDLLRENGELRKILTLMGFDHRSCICHVSSSDGYQGTSHPDFCIQYQEARRVLEETS